MSKKGSSAPDPYTTAAAQTQSNQDTAAYNASLNRVDQYTPYGSSTYTQTGADSTGAPQYRQDVKLTPLAQKELDNELQQNADLSTLGYGLYGQASQSLASPISTDGLPSLSGGPAAGNVQSSAGTAPQLQTSIGGTGAIQSGYGDGGAIQSGLDYGKLQALPSASDFNGAASAAANASYGQATSRLDPQWTHNQSDLDAKLANQGVTQGSEAWTRAQDDLGRQRNDAYDQADFSAQAAGLAAQRQGYGQALSTRQQGASEIGTAGTFANEAQQQGTAQSAAQAAFGNSAQQQGHEQQLEGAGFTNAALQQGYQNQVTGGQFANAAEAQTYAQQAQAAQQNNSARSQGLQERSTLSTLPLNQLQALRSGTQVTNPTFSSVPQSQAAGTDISGDIYKSAQLDAANSNNFMNGLFSLGSGFVGAAGKAGSFSKLFS